MRKKVSKLQPKAAPPPENAAQGRSRGSWVSVPVILAAYLLALIYARQTIPNGLNNDAAEEGLRGLYLVFGHHFEVLTFAVGNSAETLYLYLMGFAGALLGTTTLAIQLLSWLFALACLFLVMKLAGRMLPGMPEWVALLAAASSLWLFHYARSGLRAICSPLFLAVFALLLDRSERRPSDTTAALLCGGVLGLSFYGYTSNRALAIAFAMYTVWRIARAGQERIAILKRYGLVLAGAIVISTPNLWFFAQRPGDFLSRGSYVFRGGMDDRLTGLLWSVLFPFHFPSAFRAFGSTGFQFDGVAAGFLLAGFNPVPLLFAAAFAYGLWRMTTRLSEPVPAILLASWTAVVLTVGLAGPSPTRLLVLFPFYLAFAATGFGFVIADRPHLKLAVLAVLLAAGVAGGASYLSGPAVLSQYYAGPATRVGERASELSQRGTPVICIVPAQASVVKYLTFEHKDRVRILEIYRRELNPAEIPFQDMRGGVLLIQRAPQFAAFASRFPAAWVTRESDFDQVQLPAQ